MYDPQGQFSPPPPTPPARPQGPAVWPPAAAALNLTGLGLGYALLRRWILFAGYLVVTGILVVLAFVTNAGNLPWLWRILGLVWLLASVGHAWLLARRTMQAPPPQLGPFGLMPPPVVPAPTTAQRFVPIGVAVAVLAAGVTGYVLYTGAGEQTYARALAAMAKGDCATAEPAFGQINAGFALALSPHADEASARQTECTDFRTAGELRAGGKPDQAVAAYRTFRAAHPGSVLAPQVDQALLATFTEWGAARRAAGDQSGAIGIYRDALTEPNAAATLRPALADAYLERSAATRAAFAFTGPQLASGVMSAIADLLTVRTDLADTPAAAKVGQAMIDTVGAATPKLATIGPCAALGTLDYLATLPGPMAGEIAGGVATQRTAALLGCGIDRYNAGQLDDAIANFGALESAYPQAPEVAQARSARIAAEVAKAKGVPAPALPPPFAGDNPGSLKVTFFNVSDKATTVLISGSSTHQFVLPPCPGCIPGDPKACDSPRGKPSLVIRLRPGAYDILLQSGPTVTPKVATDTFNNGFDYTECLYTQ